MAGISNQPAELLLSKRVQEIVLNGEAPPALYICRDGEEADDVSSRTSPIPIIDLSLLSPSATCTNESKEELQKLKSALSSWGCFQVIDHGISSSVLDKMQKVTKEFFKQSMEEKQKLAKGLADFQGYGADPTPEEGQPLDWSDRFYLEVSPQDKRNYAFWPQNPKSFRDILEEYIEKVKMVTEITSKIMAKSLNLEEKCFLDQFGEREAVAARFNYYSCCPRPDLVLGLKPHSDATGYTVILQDEVGLQILKDDKWYTVPKHTDALLFLLGDQMEILTNRIFKSPVHRVLSNLQTERISAVMFYSPAIDKEIGPLDSLVNQEEPKLFKVVKDYGTTYFEYYNRGMRALHTVQI